MLRRRGPLGSSMSFKFLLLGLLPRPRTPCVDNTISCFFFKDRPSSPWYRTGIHISREKPGSFRPQITWCGYNFSKRSQNVESILRISATSGTPHRYCRLSLSTMYRSQFVKVTCGKSFLEGRLVLEIGISRDCPNCLKTWCVPASLRFRLTRANFRSPFEGNLVTLACRMASAQATSASTGLVRVIANTKKGPPLVEHKLNECRLKGKYIGEIQNIYIYI